MTTTPTTPDIDPAAVEAEARRIVGAAERLGVRLTRGIWWQRRWFRKTLACAAGVAAVHRMPFLFVYPHLNLHVLAEVLGDPELAGLSDGFEGDPSRSTLRDRVSYSCNFAVGRRVAELAGLGGQTP